MNSCWRGCLLAEKETMDPVGWFPRQTVKVIWQNTTSQCLQQAARPRWAGSSLSDTSCTVSCTIPSKYLPLEWDDHPPIWGQCICKESLKKGARLLFKVHPKQLYNRERGNLSTSLRCKLRRTSNVVGRSSTHWQIHFGLPGTFWSSSSTRCLLGNAAHFRLQECVLKDEPRCSHCWGSVWKAQSQGSCYYWTLRGWALSNKSFMDLLYKEETLTYCEIMYRIVK